MSEKRKRDDATDGRNNKKLIGPSLHTKPIIYAAPVTYNKKNQPPPKKAASPPPAPIITMPIYPVYPDPGLYASVAAQRPIRHFPASVKVDEAKKVKYFRKAADSAWEDPTLSDWPEGCYVITEL